jgi:hypothetical protein
VVALITWMWRLVWQWACGLRGHAYLSRYEQSRLLMVCATCDHRSHGWDLDEPMPRMRFAGDTLRHQLMKPWRPAVAPKDLNWTPAPATAVAVHTTAPRKPSRRSADHAEARLAAHRALMAMRWHEVNAALSFEGMRDARFGALCQSYVHLLVEHKRVAPATRVEADARD